MIKLTGPSEDHLQTQLDIPWVVRLAGQPAIVAAGRVRLEPTEPNTVKRVDQLAPELELNAFRIDKRVLQNDMSQLLMFGTRRSFHMNGIRRAVNAGRTVMASVLNHLSMFAPSSLGLTPVARVAGKNTA